MSTALAAFVQDGTYTQEQVDLIKQQIAKDTTDQELALFLTVCKATGLDPFRRQIYAVMRNGKKSKVGNEWVEGPKTMTIQTGIDGYRLLADRTGRYAPGQATTYEYVEGSKYPYSATAYVRKYASGTWIEYSATAMWDEYVQLKDEYKNNSKTGNKIVGDMWEKMPHTMIGKCAEALALRRGFPGELSGLYVPEEMDQADNRMDPPTKPQPQLVEVVDNERLRVIDDLRVAVRTYKRETGSLWPIVSTQLDGMTIEQIASETAVVNQAIVYAMSQAKAKDEATIVEQAA